jgi:hypothetical protein
MMRNPIILANDHDACAITHPLPQVVLTCAITHPLPRVILTCVITHPATAGGTDSVTRRADHPPATAGGTDSIRRRADHPPPLPRVVLTPSGDAREHPPATAGGTDSLTRVINGDVRSPQFMKLFLAIGSLLLAVSVACTVSRSAGSPSLVNSNATVAQSPTQTTDASAQDKPTCQLTLAGAPDIKGLRLGMTPEQVLALFPGSNEDAEIRSSLAKPPSQFGVSSFLVRPDKYRSKDNFAGISQITFSLLDGRVSSFSVGYNGPEFAHVDKFVATVVEGTNLPPADQWEAYVGMDTQLKILKCQDFEIRVFAGGPGGNLNYVLMSDLAAAKKLKDRKDKARAKATPTP